jgi:hypothetical protein
MKKLIIYSIVLLAVSCGSNDNGWKTADAKKKCIDGMKAKNIPADKLESMCGCLAEKMTAKYKTEKEADADGAGIRAMMEECAK